jgi:hypothetical protein
MRACILHSFIQLDAHTQHKYVVPSPGDYVGRIQGNQSHHPALPQDPQRNHEKQPDGTFRLNIPRSR